MPHTDFTALAEAVNAALANYRNALEKLVIQTLKKLSAADLEAEFEYTGGMGSWGFYRKGPVTEEGETESYITERELETAADPAYSAILDAQSEFDDSVVPDGYFTAKGGEVVAR